MTDYLDFAPSVTERSQIKAFIESDAGVQATEAKLYGVFSAWWQLHAPGLGELPKTKKVMELRAEFLSSFVDSLEPVGLLDRFKVAGVVASWWDEVKYELRTLSESDFGGLVDSWVDTIRDALEQDDETQKNQTKFDPLNHKLVVRLMPDYLEEIAEAEARIAELEEQKEAFERGEESEAEEGEASEELGITSIAIPVLGCGNDGLDWVEVKPLIESVFVELPEVIVIGSDSGICQATAVAFGRGGADVAVTYLEDRQGAEHTRYRNEVTRKLLFR